MIDIFLKEDINKLMKKKSIVFMGDSNIRALYKDFLCLLTQSTLISQEKLRKKMEPSVFRDTLKYHGPKSNGRDYREERECNVPNQPHVSFYFLTRVYDKYVKEVLNMMSSKRKPDVLVINCCLWDVTRWGANGVDDYKINLQTLLKRLKQLFPDCLVIWITAPPIAGAIKGGFLVQELEFLKYSLRFHVMEANYFARKVVVENGFDLLDSHYHLKMQIHRRAGDGIHWLPPAVRYVTNLLLTHISLAWNVPLPKRYVSSVLEEDSNLLEDDVPVKETVPVEETVSVEETVPAKKVKVAVKEKVVKEPDQKENKKKKRQPTSYQAKTQHKNRLQRIRKWQRKDAIEFSPSPFAASSRYNSPMPHSSQHDSGYFPSPAEASLSNEFQRSSRRNITFGSPAHMQPGYASPRYFGPYANRRMLQESYTYGGQAYNVHDIPLPSDTYQPYNFHNYQSYSVQRFPLLQEPFVSQHQTPRFDFTSDDFLAF